MMSFNSSGILSRGIHFWQDSNMAGFSFGGIQVRWDSYSAGFIFGEIHFRRDSVLAGFVFSGIHIGGTLLIWARFWAGACPKLLCRFLGMGRYADNPKLCPISKSRRKIGFFSQNSHQKSPKSPVGGISPSQLYETCRASNSD